MIFWYNLVLLAILVYSIFTAGQLSSTSGAGTLRYSLLAGGIVAHFVVFGI